MDTTWQQNHWLNKNPIQRQWVAFVVSVIIVVLILLIPIRLNYKFNQLENSIEVTLTKVFKPVETKPLIQVQENKPEIKKPITEPIIQKQSEQTKPIEKVDNLPSLGETPKLIQQPVKTTTNEQASKYPSSVSIFKSAYGKVHLYDLGEDFKARTGNQDDFKFREINQPEWNVVTKLIDEEVDKPRVMMNFYSEGIVGATEKFFDKISYKKTFTTRYGTKIYCGGVGPLAICSWK